MTAVFLRPVCPRLALLVIASVLGWGLPGCAALTNPARDGIPVTWVPEELLARPKEPSTPLPVSLLGQNKPAVYRLAPGDTLGVWIDGVFSAPNQGPPIYLPTGRSVLGPSVGYPIPVQEDGTLALPLVGPVAVEGLTIKEAEGAVRKAYTVTQPVFQPGRERMIITLLRRRTYHVIVFRDESQNFDSPGAENATLILTTTQKRGNAHSIDLPVGENDLLNALTRTGGAPGLDAYNEVIIEHRKRPAANLSPPATPAGSAALLAHQVIRIPLYLLQGEEPQFRPEDILLDDGDVVYVQARPTERFYTGGLLPPGEYVLPRDYDLDVVQAIAFVKGPLVNGGFGGFGGAGFTGQVSAPGIGAPSPRLATILRRTPDGGQVNILVDLQRAVCGDSKERILLKAGDVLILQETPGQAIARYAARVIDNLSFNFLVQQMSASHLSAGSGTVRLPGP